MKEKKYKRIKRRNVVATIPTFFCSFSKCENVISALMKYRLLFAMMAISPFRHFDVVHKCALQLSQWYKHININTHKNAYNNKKTFTLTVWFRTPNLKLSGYLCFGRYISLSLIQSLVTQILYQAKFIRFHIYIAIRFVLFLLILLWRFENAFFPHRHHHHHRSVSLSAFQCSCSVRICIERK